MHEFRRMMPKNKWLQQWTVVCLALIAVGLVFSRAVLSVGCGLVLLPFFFQASAMHNRRMIFTGLLLILLPVFISGCWSADIRNWAESITVRLPLVSIALGCSAVIFSRKNWLLVACVYLISIAIGCVWSLWQYAIDPAAMQASYLKAKVLPTLADQDYVRFSWMVMIGVLIAFRSFALIRSRLSKYILIALIVFFIIYLHILAAKTGLLCLYACAIVYMIDLMIRQRKWKTGLAWMAAAVMIIFVAYQSLPTLRNRVQYVRFDFSLYSKNGSAPGYNDAARWVSLRAGYELTNAHPFTGVGFGDMRSAINAWHEKNLPSSLAYERFLPADEWLVYGTGSGWPGMLCFTAGLLFLLYATATRQILSVLFTITAVIPLITDDTLEGQIGAVLLGFISFFGQQNPTTHYE